MAKIRAKKRASIHSRAARRATSPSINTDKSLKNVKPPLLPGANILHHVGSTNGTGAGVSKRGRKQIKTREQRLRLENAMLRAETVMDQIGKKVEESRRKNHVVKERSGAWEEINGRIKGRRRRHKLSVKDELENDDWEDAADSNEEQVIKRVGKLQVDDPSPPVVAMAKAERDMGDDDIIL